MADIKNFVELIRPFLALGEKVISYSTKNLVPVGENYGSLILAVEVKLSNGSVKQLVAKLNPQLEMFKRIFNIPIAFRKEAEFYKTIVPLLHNFQKQCNVPKLDSFAEYFGSRYSLQADPDVFDDNACLVMENLKFQGYSCIQRTELFNLANSKYILKMMAHFHALPIALKLKNPQDFAEIRKHLQLNLTDPELSEDHLMKILGLSLYVLEKDTETAFLTERVDALMRSTAKQYIVMNVQGREPFNTITHNDAWIANILLKFDDEGKPIGDRLVDFQMAAYGNPANDVLFFIHTSVQADILSSNYDQLVDCYYEEFVLRLKQYGVDTAAFSKDAFLLEIDDCAKSVQFYHILFMIVTVFLVGDLAKATEELRLKHFDLSNLLHRDYSKQLKAVILNYVKHQWL